MSLGEPLEVRERTIAGLDAQQKGDTHRVPFQGDENRYLPVRKVRIGLPKYRIENGRTMAAQRERVVNRGLTPDFFDTARAEEEEVQKAQHEILLQMARNGGTDLLSYFRGKTQTDPLILDRRGFVVNGNRRLAAMRALFQDDPQRYERFSHVNIVILPACDVRDIDELEARLQFDEDIKADYSWIAEALTLREKGRTYAFDQLASIYRKTEKEIRGLIERLEVSEAYLSRWNRSGQYHRVESAEEAFKQLQKKTRALSGSPGREEFMREISYPLIEDPEGDRVYNFIRKAPDYLDDILGALETTALRGVQPATLHEGGDLGLFGSEADPQETRFLAAARSLQTLSESQAEQVAEEVKRSIESAELRERQRQRANYVAERVREANTALQDALAARDSAQDSNGIEAQLQAIDDAVRELRTWIATRQAR